MASATVACLGDPGSHPGVIISSGQALNAFKVGGIPVAVQGAIFYCLLHGPRPVMPIAMKTFCEGKLVITQGATTSCGATILPIYRGVKAG